MTSLCQMSQTKQARDLDKCHPQANAIQAVDALAASALSHRAVRHPYLSALAAGSLPNPRWALADFAQHYEGYSSHFPRFLTALISRLESAEHRQMLLENLTEESGSYTQEELDELERIGIRSEWITGIPHPQLFRRFRLAINDVNPPDQDDHLEVICWREMFLAILSQGSAAEAIGAMGLGTEWIVPEIYQPFVQAIERYPDLAPRDTVFFPLHTEVDDHHQATLRKIAIDFAASETGCRDLARGMHKALALRDSFWSWLHNRALQASNT